MGGNETATAAKPVGISDKSKNIKKADAEQSQGSGKKLRSGKDVTTPAKEDNVPAGTSPGSKAITSATKSTTSGK